MEKVGTQHSSSTSGYNANYLMPKPEVILEGPGSITLRDGELSLFKPYHLNQEQAKSGKAILDAFKTYRNNHLNNLLSTAGKTQIFKLMLVLNKAITRSGSARTYNGTVDEGDVEIKNNLKSLAKEAGGIFKVLQECVKESYADCDDLALLLACLIKADNTISATIKDQLELCSLAEPNDHCFLKIGDFIFDPWMKYIDLPQNNSRPAKSPNESRKSGFVGSQESYLRLLADSKDKHFIKQDPFVIELKVNYNKFITNFEPQNIKNKLFIRQLASKGRVNAN